MKNFKLYLIIVAIISIGIIFVFYNKKKSPQAFEEKRPAHIMLFTCHYGAGHKMATQSIIESLPNHNIRVVDIYNEPLTSIDPMRYWAPDLSNEHIYNQLIKKEKNQFLNLAGKVAPKFMLIQKPKIEKLLTQFISKDKPDMIISCVPLVNSFLLSAANELNIPFLVITTDIDVSAFCYGLSKNLKENKSHFRITIPYNKTHWDKLFGSYFSPSLQHFFQYNFGYPTRQSFSKNPKYNALNKLRDEYEIKKDENVILIMMGGNASHASKTYAELLSQMNNENLDRILGKKNPRNKIHLICLCGDINQSKNYDFMKSINFLNNCRNSKRVRLHGCAGTPKIAELVSLPELFVVISKPGGSTVNEMIKKKVPMIYHINKHPLNWEKGNIEYGESRGLGQHFLISTNSSKNFSNFIDLLERTFALNLDMKSGQVSIPEANIDFSSNLRSTVEEMLFFSKPQKSSTIKNSK